MVPSTCRMSCTCLWFEVHSFSALVEVTLNTRNVSASSRAAVYLTTFCLPSTVLSTFGLVTSTRT